MQLLISVKNREEALLALAAGADVVDLKDPNIGALGALDLPTTAQILQALDGCARVSATAGEQQKTVGELANDIAARAELGVDIVKIAVSDLFDHADFYPHMTHLTSNGIKLIAVFFADGEVDFRVLPKLQRAGFYGAMLDTQNKQHALLENKPTVMLPQFVKECEKCDLVSGMAGSLRPQDVDFLAELKPVFIGFRGGVCKNFVRKSSVSLNKMTELKNMLLKHNKFSTNTQKSMNLALHS